MLTECKLWQQSVTKILIHFTRGKLRRCLQLWLTRAPWMFEGTSPELMSLNLICELGGTLFEPNCFYTNIIKDIF